MNVNTSHPPLRYYAIGVCLTVLLIAVYFVTYNGYAISRDEWFLFDATESMARRGDLAQNYEFDAYPPQSAAEATPPPANTEPLQPILAAPLFLIAQHLPGIGLAHTVWLFNVLTTALTAGVLYAYGLARGYRAQVAALAALVFGLCTIAWPYSRTFFREPLFTLLALLSTYLVLRIRQQLAAEQRPIMLIAWFAISFAGALLSKEASLLLVPAIAVEAFPARHLTRTTLIVLVLLVVIGGLLLIVVLNLEPWFGIEITRFDLTHRIQQARDNLNDMAKGVTGYLFSPARSLWVFSPVLLLGLAGWIPLARSGHWREIAVPLVMASAFILGYAVVRGSEQWYGGRGWGPRYLVPVTPFVTLWLLPLIDSLVKISASRWQRLSVGVVALFSAGIQLLAALVPIDVYYHTLDARQIIAWNEGAWSIRWSPIVVSLEHLGDQTADIAWRHAVGSAWLLPVLALILAGIALASLLWWQRCKNASPRAAIITFSGLLIATGIALFGGLYAIREDPRYYGDFAPTQALLDLLEANTQPGDVIVLNNNEYAEFFMNYYKHADPIVYTLPLAPGERFSAEQTPEIESPHPEGLIHPGSTVILNNLAAHHDRLWLVINSSPFISWSNRPAEHYLARHYFPVRELVATDIARAILFDTTAAPLATATIWPERRTNATFDGDLLLVGADIPGGTRRAPGDMLPVSLMWETLNAPPQDYTVALFLMAADVVLKAQRDSFPINHFAFTSTWEPGTLHRDNHGVVLPDDLPPGDYELWVVLYWWQEPGARLPVINADGNEIGDHVVLATITIE